MENEEIEKEIELIYKQEILNKLSEGSMLKYLIITIKPLIINAMRKSFYYLK